MKTSLKIRFSSILSTFLLLTLLAVSTTAQTSPVFRLDGGNSTYAFGVNEHGELQPLYWGGRLGAHDTFPPAHSFPEMASFDSPYTTTPQEYAGWGAGIFTEPALKVTFADGNRDLVLHFVRVTQNTPQAVELQLKDISREIYVTLRYSIDPESGILARSADIENREKQPVVIEQAAAAQWTLPPARYTLSYLTGRWAGEWTLTQEPILGGERVIESRRGTTGHQANPWFAISRDDSQSSVGPIVAGEEHGEVWFGALAWSGSWRIIVEHTQLDAVRVTGGFNPFDFGYKLKPGEHLETPTFYGGYSDHIVVDEAYVLSLLKGLDPAAAAPLLCAGITTYSPLKHWNVGPGMKVGVVGLGGLGHMGLKFSHAFGAKTVQFTTSAAKVEDAQRLGADEVILTKEPNWAAQHAHSFDFILDCVSANHDVDTYLRLLKRNGVMCSVGIPEIPVSIHAFSVLGRKAFTGSMVGGIRETQGMLDFCAENGIVSDIEMTSFSNLEKAWERVVKADVKYRFVLDLKTL